MAQGDLSGHRQRLKDRFIAGDEASRTDEALLELLLTYAIPQRDVQPLVRDLIAHFGNLSGVLGANVQALCRFDGIKAHGATLVKLIDWIRLQYASEPSSDPDRPERPMPVQAALFQEEDQTASLDEETEADAPSDPEDDSSRRPSQLSRGTGLFAKAVMKETIDLLPRLPDTESLDEVRAFLRDNLHYSAEQTRRRNADYIVRRMFPDGYADSALRSFARQYSGQQELGDVCFYRFCNAEAVMFDIVDELLIPAMGAGRLNRSQIRSYLTNRFPSSKSIVDYAKAIVDAMADSGIVRADRQKIGFAYREILLPSFAFVLHSEFPEPGMYAIADMHSNQAIRAMLWNPDRLLPALYELRNRGWIAKVSEIDSFRQFTVRYELDELAIQLARAH